MVTDAGHKLTPDTLGMISKQMGVPVQSVRAMANSRTYSSISGRTAKGISETERYMLSFIEEYKVAQGLVEGGFKNDHGIKIFY